MTTVDGVVVDLAVRASMVRLLCERDEAGACSDVERSDGQSYSEQRWEYEGKPCMPPY